MFHHTRADHELAQRHVTEGERRVARQRDPIAELEQDGHSIEQAGDLLQNMVDLLDEMLKHSEDSQKMSGTIDGQPHGSWFLEI